MGTYFSCQTTQYLLSYMIQFDRYLGPCHCWLCALALGFIKAQKITLNVDLKDGKYVASCPHFMKVTVNKHFLHEFAKKCVMFL